jgi:hypothetical protein
MPYPTFFIIGGPKCGTTSLASWLGEHPNIYMPPIKEPHYFDWDVRVKNRLTPEEYYSLFDNAGTAHCAIGEASVYYLYSDVAVPAIERDLPKRSYIALLRNPVDMAYSLHEQMVYNGFEQYPDFWEAWRLQDRRREGHLFNDYCQEPKALVYGDTCSLGAQLSRLLDRVDRHRILILFLEDLQIDPKGQFEKCLTHLGVPMIDRRDFAVQNPAKERRSMVLRHLTSRLGRAKRSLLGPWPRLGIFQRLDAWNKRERPRRQMPPDQRRALIEYFAEDIALIEACSGRRLDHWKA